MKTLLQSTVWVPVNQPSRLETLRRHLTAIASYKGNFDVHLVINSLSTPMKQLLEETLTAESGYDEAFMQRVTQDRSTENRGWCWSRNCSLAKMIDEGYDLCVLIDCDTWVEDKEWVIKSQEAAKSQNAFMCRKDEPQFRTAEGVEAAGQKWDVYTDWLGCINVVTRTAVEAVGGYDLVSFPQAWGFHDHEYGFRLTKAGFFTDVPRYPSLAGLGVIEEHDPEYNERLNPVKVKFFRSYMGKAGEEEARIFAGEKPLFFDYKTNQQDFIS